MSIFKGIELLLLGMALVFFKCSGTELSFLSVSRHIKNKNRMLFLILISVTDLPLAVDSGSSSKKKISVFCLTVLGLGSLKLMSIIKLPSEMIDNHF